MIQLDTEKDPTEIIDSYLYALVKNKRYTEQDIIEALSFIASGKVEYKSGGNHPLELLGTRNVQKELFKSIIKKCTLKENRGEPFPFHSLEYHIMDKIEKEGVEGAFEDVVQDEVYLNRMAEDYIKDHFELEDRELFYSGMHEDMNTFMIQRRCELLFSKIDNMDSHSDITEEEESNFHIEENKSEEVKTFQSDMEKLEYCLSYMQKRQGYQDKTMVDILNAALEGNYKVFTREDGIRSLAEEVPKTVLANKKALILLDLMEEN